MARSTKQISITLPNEMADEVRAKVESGEYASESEVIRDGLRALRARDRAVEDWLRNVAAPIHDAMKGDPSRGIPMENVRSRLAAEHERATAERRKRQPKR